MLKKKAEFWIIEFICVIIILCSMFVSSLNMKKYTNYISKTPAKTVEETGFLKIVIYYLKPKSTIQKKELRATAVSYLATTPTEEDILEEDRLGDMELLAQLAQAEAGNQGVQGMRYVVCVVLNRVESPRFPDTIEEVIFQPGAFGVVTDGAFDRAAWHMSPECFEAVELEMQERSDTGILYFNTEWVNGRDAWRYKGHWFSY